MKLTVLFTAIASLGLASAQSKLKFMPLGDSITEITCWRALLWDGLVAAGVTSNLQFVGSMTDNPENCVANDPNWDKHHEGHSGFLAIDIANSDLTGWLASAQPDIVQFMLGTNDVVQGHSTSDIIAAYTKMVQEMRASNPNMKILVDLVIPLPLSPTGIEELNAAIPAWAESQNSTNSPIYIVDCNTGFTSSMLRDGVHPNAQGDQLIESRILPVLLQAIGGSTGGSAPTSTTLVTSPTSTSPATSPTGGTLPKYSQCGGQGWTGSGTCVSGTTCQYSNQWYSQCL